MIEHGLYYADPKFSTLVRATGGEWNDVKHRPIVCLVKSSEHDDLYWAIPMGKWDHRTKEQQARIQKYLDADDKDIRSCFYHRGRTTTKSIFFITDAIPITDAYIAEEHVGPDNNHYIIKNAKLISELKRKLFRILALENSKPNRYRQHITDVKQQLLEELRNQEATEDQAPLTLHQRGFCVPSFLSQSPLVFTAQTFHALAHCIRRHAKQAHAEQTLLCADGLNQERIALRAVGDTGGVAEDRALEH